MCSAYVPLSNIVCMDPRQTQIETNLKEIQVSNAATQTINLRGRPILTKIRGTIFPSAAQPSYWARAGIFKEGTKAKFFTGKKCKNEFFSLKYINNY